MTREEAILLLHDMKDTYDEIHENTNWDIGYEQMTALDMAIEALRREEAEEKGYCHRINYTPKPCENANCDCVEVVRCKDCKWEFVCQQTVEQANADDVEHRPLEWCSVGERKEE